MRTATIDMSDARLVLEYPGYQAHAGDGFTVSVTPALDKHESFPNEYA